MKILTTAVGLSPSFSSWVEKNYEGYNKQQAW